jgi:hypothetical protein
MNDITHLFNKNDIQICFLLVDLIAKLGMLLIMYDHENQLFFIKDDIDLQCISLLANITKTVNQFENNDIEWAEKYAENYGSIGPFSLTKKIKLTVIRPKEPLHIELTDFTTNDVKEIIKKGYEYGHEALFS